MKLFVVLLSLAWLPACGVTRNRAVGSFPDGSLAQEIDCRRDHPEKCQQRAHQLCEPFGREPQIVRPLAYNELEARWTTVITCGPAIAGPPAQPGMAYRPNGPPSPPGGPPPAATFKPLPPEYPPSSNRPQ